MKTSKITSKENPKIKHIKKLIASKEYRYKNGEYVIEGINAAESIKKIKEVYVVDEKIAKRTKCENIFVIDRKIFAGLSATENPAGLLAVAEIQLLYSKDIKSDGKYIYLDRLQDPGNLGTIIRIAAAFEINGIIISNGTVDPFSPKVVRAAASCIDKINIIKINDPKEIKGNNLIGADMSGVNVSDFNPPESFILCVGNEANGLSEEIINMLQQKVSVRISDKVESLNAAVSAGIIIHSFLEKNS